MVRFSMQMNDKASEGLPLPPDRMIATAAFFLNIDGTLFDIANDPDSVVPDAEIVALVKKMHAMANGAVALVSGRSLAEIDQLFQPLRLPVAGQHGAERRNTHGGIRHYVTSKGALTRARIVITKWLQGCPKLLVEQKSLSIAIHYHQAPELALPLETILRKILVMFPDLDVKAGKMVFEVKPAGLDKGFAIREFMAEQPFAGKQPVFLGDDASDEVSFMEINALGGVSIKAGIGPTAARFCLPNIVAVRDWMNGLLR